MSKLIFPNFLGVGAGKAGTSWLHVCFEEHPEILVPQKVKEVDFFSREYHRGLDWYADHFNHYAGEPAIGEISPTYMVVPGMPELIKKFNPDMRLLFLLRNPIDRAYSHYCMHLRGGKVSDDVAAEILPETRYVTEGFYFSHISRFLEHFDRDQMIFLIYDDLQNQPHQFLRETFNFLGVDPNFEPEYLHKTYHARKSRPRFQAILNGLVKIQNLVSENSVLGKRIADQIKASKWVDVVHKLNKGPEFPAWPDEKKSQIAKLYLEDTAKLSKLLDRDLNHWLEPNIVN